MSKIAFIFPGQGAQKAGMGKDFYENSKTAAEVIDRASELLGLDMKALCFEENDLLDGEGIKRTGTRPGCHSRLKPG